MKRYLPTFTQTDEAFIELCYRYLDDATTPAELAELQRMLRLNDEYRSQFVSICLHNELMAELESAGGETLFGDSALSAEEQYAKIAAVLEREHQAREQRRAEELAATKRKNEEIAERHALQQMLVGKVGTTDVVRNYVIPRWVVYGAAAAIVVLLALVMVENAPVDDAPLAVNEEPASAGEAGLAVIDDANGAVWEEETYNIGDEIGQGHHRLAGGMVRLAFDNGAVVTLQAPVSFEVVSPSEISLAGGRLVGLCPTPASHGFTVSHQNRRVVDRGTEFAVSVQDSDMQVVVFDGEVVCETLDSRGKPMQSLLLGGGQAAVSRYATQSFEEKAIEVEQFADMRGQSRKWMVAAQGPVALQVPSPHHVLQGFAVDDEGIIYWGFQNELIKTDHNGYPLARLAVEAHQGALEYHNGKLYCPVTIGVFNKPAGQAETWVYVYDANDLTLLEKHAVPELVHGVGGVKFHDGHFYLIGGLPIGVEENYVFRYDADFNFQRKYVLPTGYITQGLQTIEVIGDRFYFGCYGQPERLVVADLELRLIGVYEFDCPYGLEMGGDGRVLYAPHAHKPHIIFAAEPSETAGLVDRPFKGRVITPTYK